MVLGWADIPELSTCVGCCSAPWLQSWLQSRRNGADPRPSAFQAGHIPSWHESCESYALLPVPAGSRWPLLLLSSARHVRAPGTFQSGPGFLVPAPSPHRTDGCRPIRWSGGVKARFALYVDQALSPVLVVLSAHQVLMPERRRITIRRQSGGGPLQFPRSSETRWSSSDRCQS